MRVQYRQTQPLQVLYVRAMGPYGSAAREAWGRMNAWLDSRRARQLAKQGLGYFRDNPRLVEAELLRYDACVPMMFGLDADPAAVVHRQTLPGGAYAVHTHTGAYAEAGELFSRLHSDVIPKRGLTVDASRPFLAVYLNDPAVTREMHRRTELCVPVLPMCMPLAGN